jgi:hypothetical protein
MHGFKRVLLALVRVRKAYRERQESVGQRAQRDCLVKKENEAKREVQANLASVEQQGQRVNGAQQDLVAQRDQKVRCSSMTAVNYRVTQD